MNTHSVDKRLVSYILTVMIAACIHSPAFSRDVVPCAIRWDAWYDRRSSSEQAQDSLSSSEWRFRAPIHCSANLDQQLRCVGTQAVMDAEIQTAAEKGGLDCWAFDKYASDSSLSTAWKLYQNSMFRDRVHWAWILGLNRFGDAFTRERELSDLVSEMRLKNYQTVTIDGQRRPVLFVLWRDQEFAHYFSGSLTNFFEVLSNLGCGMDKIGLGRPFVVILSGTPEKAARIATAVGGDAIGSYINPLRPQQNGSYQSLAEQSHAFWARLRSTGLPIVPTIMTGFDQRPTIAHSLIGSDKTQPRFYYEISTYAEWHAEVQAAVAFIRAYPSADPVSLLLVYSWNENSEGGGALNPTVSDPEGYRLEVFRAALGLGPD